MKRTALPDPAPRTRAVRVRDAGRGLGLTVLALFLLSTVPPSRVHAAPATAVSGGSSGEARVLEPRLPGPVPAGLLRTRRAALAAALGEGVALVEARGGPEADPVTRDFLYLTGIETPGAILLVECREGRGESTLFLPPHDPRYERWHGPRLAPGPRASERTGIDEVRPLADFEAACTAALERAARVGAGLWHEKIPHEDSVAPDLELPSPEERWAAEMRARHPGLGTVAPIDGTIARLRQVKDAEELSRLRRAISITGAAFERAFATVVAGGSEFALESEIEATFRRLGATGPGYDSIIGAGDRSCILHYQRNDGPVAAGAVVLIDVGASWGGYTADITRTLPVDGRFSERQRTVFQLVARAQAAGIAAARPGATIRDVHRAARAVFEEAGVAAAFLHGTSHHVGLEVHDPGPLGRAFEPGMVITVEPGLYFPEEGLGIRLEDMILITAAEPVILSSEIPRTPEEIEAAVARARGGDAVTPPEDAAPSRARRAF